MARVEQAPPPVASSSPEELPLKVRNQLQVELAARMGKQSDSDVLEWIETYGQHFADILSEQGEPLRAQLTSNDPHVREAALTGLIDELNNRAPGAAPVSSSR